MIPCHTQPIGPFTGAVDAVSFSPDGKFIVTGGIDKTVRIWEAEIGSLVHTLTGHTAQITSVSFSPDGKQISSSSRDKTARIWNASDGQEIHRMAGHVGAEHGRGLPAGGVPARPAKAGVAPTSGRGGRDDPSSVGRPRHPAAVRGSYPVYRVGPRLSRVRSGR